MLQQGPHDESEIPAAQIRVRSEELARALASIEARREEEARLLEGTVPIGEVVQELQLDATPEEVWAEIQKQRAEASAQRSAVHTVRLKPERVPPEAAIPSWAEHEGDGRVHTQTRSTGQETRILAGVVVAASLLCVLGLGVSLTSTPRPPKIWNPRPVEQPRTQTISSTDAASRIVRTLDTDFYHNLRLSQGPNPTFRLLRVSFDFPSQATRPEEVLYPSRAIPDGYSIYENAWTAGPSASQRCAIVFRQAGDAFTARPNNSGGNVAFPLIIVTRYDGIEYLRCWIRKKDKSALLHGHGLSLYTSLNEATASTGEAFVPLTVALQDNYLKHGLDPYFFYQQFRPGIAPPIEQVNLAEGHKVKLDRHAWEDFRTITLPEAKSQEWSRLPGVFNDIGGSLDVWDQYSEFDGSSVVKAVGEIPDGQTFHCGGTKLREITRPAADPSRLPHIPVPQILVDVRSNLYLPYTLVKREGHLYLRGWVAARLSKSQLAGHRLNVYGDPTVPVLGYSPTQITLRLDQCVLWPDYGEMGPMVTVAEVHLDRHAWEKWRPS